MTRVETVKFWLCRHLAWLDLVPGWRRYYKWDSEDDGRVSGPFWSWRWKGLWRIDLLRKLDWLDWWLYNATWSCPAHGTEGSRDWECPGCDDHPDGCEEDSDG